eukprot:363197-Chlamydomonas_euryale.AAC.11
MEDGGVPGRRTHATAAVPPRPPHQQPHQQQHQNQQHQQQQLPHRLLPLSRVLPRAALLPAAAALLAISAALWQAPHHADVAHDGAAHASTESPGWPKVDLDSHPLVAKVVAGMYEVRRCCVRGGMRSFLCDGCRRLFVCEAHGDAPGMRSLLCDGCRRLFVCEAHEDAPGMRSFLDHTGQSEAEIFT